MSASSAGASEPHQKRVTGVWITTPRTTARVFGLTAEERHHRSFQTVAAILAGPRPPRADPDSRWLVVRGDTVLDPRLCEALLGAPELVLVDRDDAGLPIAAVVNAARLHEAADWVRDGKPPGSQAIALAHADDLVHPYDPRLRKREPALVTRLTPQNARAVEQRLFQLAYKGVTDWVTRTLWPAPALHAVRGCVRLGIPPNIITLASYALVVGAFAAFAQGALGAGLAMAWLMTFLDTVDGKLARVTLRSSRLGHVLDHGLDLVHPPFWWWAFGAGLGAGALGATPLEIATWTCVIGYGVGRLLEGVFLAGFGFELHSYRPVDSVFRRLTARRNPNLVLLTAGTLAGRPELGLLGVAGWTVASTLFHAVRIVQAVTQRARGIRVMPWEEELAA